MAIIGGRGGSYSNPLLNALGRTWPTSEKYTVAQNMMGTMERLFLTSTTLHDDGTIDKFVGKIELYHKVTELNKRLDKLEETVYGSKNTR